MLDNKNLTSTDELIGKLSDLHEGHIQMHFTEDEIRNFALHEDARVRGLVLCLAKTSKITLQPYLIAHLQRHETDSVNKDELLALLTVLEQQMDNVHFPNFNTNN